MNHKLELLQEYQEPNFLFWLFEVFVDWTILISCFFGLAYCHWVFAPLFIVVIGARQHGLGLMAHEATHYNLTSTRWLNDLVASLFTFWPLGYGCDAYRQFHFNHHRHVGKDEDPEQIYKKKRRPLWDLPVTRKRVWLNYATDFLGLSVHELFHIIITLKPISWADRLGPLLVWGPAIFAAYYWNLWWVLGVWIFCLATSFWAASRIRIWSEHIGTEGTLRFKANLLERFLFFPHNTWCHYEHHQWQNIPCRLLPKARLLDGDEPVIESFGALLKQHESFKIK